MIPIRDVIPSRTTPWVTIGLIAANVLMFLRLLMLPLDDVERYFATYGLVPTHFSWVAVFTSMFVHSGWAHIGSNLLSLWIFGDNVEDRMGHGRFLVFYLLAGVVAALLQSWVNADSALPLVGASGAIAGVMGAYLVLFPHSRVLVLVFLLLFVDVVEIPAVFFLGFWFLFQVLSGVGRVGESAGGVAFWAHIGGFLTGVATVALFRRPERQEVNWWNT